MERLNPLEKIAAIAIRVLPTNTLLMNRRLRNLYERDGRYKFKLGQVVSLRDPKILGFCPGQS